MTTWKKVTLKDLIDLQRGYDLPSQDRKPGNIPVMGGGGMNGCHSESNVMGPGVVIGRSGAGFGTAFYCETDFWAHNTVLFVKDFKNNHIKYVYHFLNAFDFSKYNSGGAQPSLNRNFIYPIEIKIPSFSEQKNIAMILDKWDDAIEKTAQMIGVKEKQYIWLLSNLISNDKHNCGHVRDFASEVSTRNNGTIIDLVLSVTNNRGFVLPSDQFERRVASSDLSNYKIVIRGQYAYNPSRINVGSIARLDGWDKGVLSPMYVVFELNEKKVNSDYFLHWLESYEAKEHIRNSAQGSVRETVSFTDFGAISFPLPSINEQRKIAAVLNMARNEIDLVKKQLEAYRKQKRGLMQKLLTGQWRVKIDDKKTIDHIK